MNKAANTRENRTCPKCGCSELETVPVPCPECEPGQYDCYDDDCYWCDGYGYKDECQNCKQLISRAYSVMPRRCVKRDLLP